MAPWMVLQVQEELEAAVEDDDAKALESIKEQLAAFAEVTGCRALAV
jgi:hypothetical protein